MKLLRFCILALIAVGLAACGSDNSGWTPPTDTIGMFIAEYFPNEAYSQKAQTDGSIVVTLRNGPTVTFSQTREWTSVDGNGATIPEQFVFDCLPSQLVEYLTELEVTHDIYSASRNATEYRIILSNSYITYNISTKQIIGPIEA